MRRPMLSNIDALLILLLASSSLSLPIEIGSGLASVTVTSPIPDGDEAFSTTSTSTTANPDSQKRGRWHKYEHYEYYVSLSFKHSSYSLAEGFCNKQNGSLAQIKSDKTQRFIASLVAKDSGTPYGFFIGLRFLNETNGWRWDDNQTVSYTHWQSGHPRDTAGKQCVMMGYNYEYMENLPWYNTGCKESSSGVKGLICQRYLGGETTTQVVTTGTEGDHSLDKTTTYQTTQASTGDEISTDYKQPGPTTGTVKGISVLDKTTTYPITQATTGDASSTDSNQHNPTTPTVEGISTPESSTVNSSIIVGGVIGPLSFVSIVVLIFYMRTKKRKLERSKTETQDTDLQNKEEDEEDFSDKDDNQSHDSSQVIKRPEMTLAIHASSSSQNISNIRDSTYVLMASPTTPQVETVELKLIKKNLPRQAYEEMSLGALKEATPVYNFAETEESMSKLVEDRSQHGLQAVMEEQTYSEIIVGENLKKNENAEDVKTKMSQEKRKSKNKIKKPRRKTLEIFKISEKPSDTTPEESTYAEIHKPDEGKSGDPPAKEKTTEGKITEKQKRDAQQDVEHAPEVSKFVELEETYTEMSRGTVNQSLSEPPPSLSNNQSFADQKRELPSAPPLLGINQCTTNDATKVPSPPLCSNNDSNVECTYAEVQDGSDRCISFQDSETYAEVGAKEVTNKAGNSVMKRQNTVVEHKHVGPRGDMYAMVTSKIALK